MQTPPAKAVTFAPLIGRLPADPQARLKKAASEFEAIWTEQFMKEARPKSAGAGVFGKSFASETFQDMTDQVLACGMAQRGAFGLSRALVQQISQKACIKEGP